MAKYNYQKQISNTVNPTIFFPNKLMHKDYNGKRVYIRIYKSKTFEEISDIVKKGITRELKRTGDAVVSAMKTGEVADSLGKICEEIDYFKGTELMILALPLPNEFQDSQTHSFNTGTGMLHDLVDMIPGSAKVTNAIARAAANTSSQKIMANPGYYQNYTGSEPRQFSFTFKLIPNSLEEADNIKRIILNLKKYSSPSLHNGAIMMAPHFFWFQFSNKIIQDLTGIRPCIITNISTNYAGSGILETTFDGMPKFIELTIAISELRTLTEKKW